MNTDTPDMGMSYHTTRSGVQLCMIVIALTRWKMWGSLRSGRRISSHPWQHSPCTHLFSHTLSQEELEKYLVLFSTCKLTDSPALFPPLFLPEFKFLEVPGLRRLFVPLIGKRGTQTFPFFVLPYLWHKLLQPIPIRRSKFHQVTVPYHISLYIWAPQRPLVAHVCF